MAEAGGSTEDGKTGENGGAGNGDENNKQEQQNQFQPVTYKTQEELDAAFKDRVERAESSAKTEALKAFTDAGATPEQALEAWTKWKAEEDKKKGPEAVEREKRQEAERELAQYKNKELLEARRKEAAKDPALKINDQVSLPAELLSGNTKEEMVENGKAIIAFFTGAQIPRAPGYNPGQGHSGDDKVNSGDPLRNFMQTGSFQ